MSLEFFSAVFWVCAVVTIALKSSETLKTRALFIKLIKPIPALAGAVFIIFMQPSANLFYLILTVALVFCALGDIGMEVNILPGLGFFIFSHIFYTATFLWQSMLFGLQMMALVVVVACIALMLIYIFFYQNYLKTTTKEVLPAMFKAVSIYALMISLTLSASLLLWLTSGTLLGFIPFAGAAFFVFSDSVIGIREFHHDIKNGEIIILSTYFLAIFLLSLSVLIYTV